MAYKYYNNRGIGIDKEKETRIKKVNRYRICKRSVHRRLRFHLIENIYWRLYYGNRNSKIELVKLLFRIDTFL